MSDRNSVRHQLCCLIRDASLSQLHVIEDDMQLGLHLGLDTTGIEELNELIRDEFELELVISSEQTVRQVEDDIHKNRPASCYD